MITYAATAQNAYGQNLRAISNIISLQAARAANTVGSATIVLPDEYLPSFWQRDMRFKLYRSTGSGPRYLLGNTIWIAKKFRKSVFGKFWTISLVDSLDLVNRHIVAYTAETTYADKTALNGNDDTADNLMKEFLRENYGVDAVDTLRDMSAFFTIEQNKGLGVVVEKSAAFQDTLTVLKNLADDSAERGTKLFFDMLPDANDKLIFRVFKDRLGTDRPGVRFGPQYKNMTDIDLEWNYADEITVAYVGGMGEGAAQLVEEVKDNARIIKSPFGRREAYISFADIDVDTVLESEGNAYLWSHTPRLTVTGRAIDTPSLQFGRNYFYGDTVRAVVDGMEVTCHNEAFSVAFEQEREELDVRLRGETEL